MMNAINRRTAIRQLGLAVGSAGLWGCAGLRKQTSSERPNILVILSDDHQFRALGAAGNAEIRTPHLDRLANEGTRFTHCFVSNPICTPSRAAIQTGQYGFRNGVTFFGMPIRPESPRIAELLNERGYGTSYTGKWHNNGRPCDHGFQRMRNVFLGGMHNYESIPVVQGRDDPKVELKGNPTDRFTEGTMELLANAKQPFAHFLCFTAPHDPRKPPRAYERQYPSERISLPKNFMPEPPFDTGTLEIRDEKLLPRPLNAYVMREEIGRYYAMITHIDQRIGELMTFLKLRGQLENTVIIFAGDNGLTLGAHGLLGKQCLYEEGVRVPLILRGPGVKAGQVCDQLVDLMDIMPTMCEMAGAPIPKEVQGRSLMPWLQGGHHGGRKEIFCHYHDLFRMIRTREHKLITHLKTGREELFNMRADPYELNDLSHDPNARSVLELLQTRLKAWRTELGDTTAA